MLEFEQALKLILSNTNELPVEETAVEGCVGCMLRCDIYSTIEMPPFNKSAMDGYAVKFRDVQNTPVRLKNIAFIQAGQTVKRKVRRGECAKIMTGASLPQGADSVVMVEDAREAGASIEIMKSVKKRSNVCFQGEDIKKGQKILEKGRMLSVSDVALLATVGLRFVRVTKNPSVAVLNTGGEIVPAGCKLSKRQIYNSNGPQLLALLKSDGINPCFLGIAKDRPQELRKAIRSGFKFDILLISGGVSMGDYDLVPGILGSQGVKEIFHNVKTKPGKPLFFGKRKNTLFFGIPGNPVSNFLAYLIYIRPALYKMMGRIPYKSQFEEGVLEREFHQKPGRKHFVLAKILNKDHCSYVVPVGSHGSADILALSKADGFMVLDADVSIAKAKSKIKFITWKNKQ